MSDEFSIIRKYFSDDDQGRLSVPNGDDCAVFRCPPLTETAVTTDSLVEGVHFFKGTSPGSLGVKAVEVNLSDLAAMGARPFCIFLSLVMPSPDEEFLSPFSAALKADLARKDAFLAGGNMSRGPLSITVTALGTIPEGTAVRRDGAKAGDVIAVTGSLGAAALAVEDTVSGHISVPPSAWGEAVRRLESPEARTEEGIALRGLAHSMLDISDGISSDLRHLLHSGLGAEISLESLPFSPALSSLAEKRRIDLAAAGGGDYELLFTMSEETFREAEKIPVLARTGITKIGRITDTGRAEYLLHGVPCEVPDGWNHFRH